MAAAYPAKALTNLIFYLKFAVIGAAFVLLRSIEARAALIDRDAKPHLIRISAIALIVLWVAGDYRGAIPRVHAERAAGIVCTEMSAAEIIDTFGRSSGVFDVMNTAWAWPIAESLHFIGFSLLLGTIGVVDLRLLGVAKAIR